MTTPEVPYVELTPDADLTESEKTSFYERDGRYIGNDIIADPDHPRAKYFSPIEKQVLALAHAIRYGDNPEEAIKNSGFQFSTVTDQGDGQMMMKLTIDPAYIKPLSNDPKIE